MRGIPVSTKVTTDGTSAHIDAERLAAWADHGLPPADAAEVELHLSECERCQEVLAAFVRSEPATAVVIPFWARRPVRWSAAGLAAAAALFLIVRTQLPTVPVPDSVVATAREESAAQRTAAPPVPEAPKASPAAPDDARQNRRSDEFAARDAKKALESRAESKEGLRKNERGRAATPVEAPPPPPVSVAGAVQAMPPPPRPATPPSAVVLGGIAGGSAAGAGGGRAGIPTTMNESIMLDSARANVVEIAAPGPAVLRRMAALGPRGRDAAAPAEFRQQSAPARWRIFAGMRVELSLDSGATWIVLPIEPALTTPLVAGVAAGQSVCWLVGPEGVVLLTTDGRTFRRVSLPERVQLVSVTAEDDLRATVTAADGRKFSTVDGGVTWK